MCMTTPKFPEHPRLERLRKRRGWKRSHLASLVGISYQHVYGIERGHNAAAEETLQAIANALGVDLEEIQENPVASRPDAASDTDTTAPAAEADEAVAASEEVSAA